MIREIKDAAARKEMLFMRKVRATGPLRAVKTGYIAVSVLFCVLGVVLFSRIEKTFMDTV